MHRLPLATAFLFAIPAAIASPVIREKPIPFEFTMNKGTKYDWEFRVGDNEKGNFPSEIIDDVLAKDHSRRVQEKSSVTLGNLLLQPVTEYHITPNSVTKTTRDLFDGSPRTEIILKFPLHIGDEWICDEKAEQKLMDRVKAEEWIRVPAGRFRCIRVERSDSSIRWYASGVGLVKVSYDGEVVELAEVQKPEK